MSETVLLVCTSSPPNVNTAMKILRGAIFQSPQIDLLCFPSEISHYEEPFPVRSVMVFPRRGDYAAAVKLCRRIRKTKYDVVAALWCREAGRSQAKGFAFLCGGRRLLVFNENLDCDYLKPSYLLAILSSRLREGTLLPRRWPQRIQASLRIGLWGISRFVLAPLRLMILLVSAGLLRCSKSRSHKL
ncbi:MAG: hypothetical protein U0V70_01460 [Terriglobia bacterium]